MMTRRMTNHNILIQDKVELFHLLTEFFGSMMKDQRIIIIDSIKMIFVPSSKVENFEVNKNDNTTLLYKITPTSIDEEK